VGAGSPALAKARLLFLHHGGQRGGDDCGVVAHGGEIVQPIGADAPEITARFRDPGGKRDRPLPAARLTANRFSRVPVGILTEDMKRVVNEQRLGFRRLRCARRTPNLSPKGTTASMGPTITSSCGYPAPRERSQI